MPLDQRQKGVALAQSMAAAKPQAAPGPPAKTATAKPAASKPSAPKPAPAKPCRVADPPDRRLRREENGASSLVPSASASRPKRCSANSPANWLGGKPFMCPRARSCDCRRDRLKAVPRRRRRARACAPALLPGRGGLGSRPIRAGNALRPEQGVEPMMIEPRVGDLGERRLGAIGDAKARFLDHRPMSLAPSPIARRPSARQAQLRRAPRPAQHVDRRIDDRPSTRRSAAVATPRNWPRTDRTRRLGDRLDKGGNPPDTRRRSAPRARMVRTSVAAPGIRPDSLGRHERWRFRPVRRAARRARAAPLRNRARPASRAR